MQQVLAPLLHMDSGEISRRSPASDLSDTASADFIVRTEMSCRRNGVASACPSDDADLHAEATCRNIQGLDLRSAADDEY